MRTNLSRLTSALQVGRKPVVYMATKTIVITRRLVFSWIKAFNIMYQASLEFLEGWAGLEKIPFMGEV